MNRFDQFTEYEKEIILMGLQVRSNYIQTGDVNLTAGDAVKRGKANMVKPLQINQMELLVDSNKLVNEILSSNSPKGLR